MTKTTNQTGAADLTGLADPNEVAAKPAAKSSDVILPAATAPEVATVAARLGLSGDTVKIQLAPGEGEAGKEAQFVRVNEHTWLVPRNAPAIVPVEAYLALAETVPPIPEGSNSAFFAPRFSVSVLERYPAPQQ